MERSVEYYRDMLKAIKFPVINLNKFKHMEKPPRWVVLVIAFLIEIILMFIILWLCDERTVFKNDYAATKYSGDYMKWGWVHIGTVITTAVAGVIWFFTVVGGELLEYPDNKRVFYSLYR